MYFLRYLRVWRSMVFLVVCWVCQPLNMWGFSSVVSSFASWVRFLSVPRVFSKFRSMEYWRFVKPNWFWRLWSFWIWFMIWAASL